MPANLPPQYFEDEKRYRGAKTPQEKIEALEEMFALRPKHRGTDRLRADHRTKTAKFYEEAEKRPFMAKRGAISTTSGRRGRDKWLWSDCRIWASRD
jgi:uncharacterized protein